MGLLKQKKTKSFKFFLIILLIVGSSRSLKGFSKSKQIAKQSKPQQVQKKDHQVTSVVNQTHNQKQKPKTSIDNNGSPAQLPNTSVHQSTTAVSTTAVSAPTTTVGFTSSTLGSQTSRTEAPKQEYPSVVQPTPSALQPIVEEPLKVPAASVTVSPQISNMKPPYSFKIKSSDNQYVIPVQISGKQYSFGILYAGKQEKNGQFPSWVFTSLTDDDKDGGHQLCDENGDCQQIQNYIKCQEKSGKGQQNNSCYQQGKLKYNQQNISCKKKIKLKFSNSNQQFQSIFASPSKITLKHTKISQGQIQGMINLSLDNELYYSKVNSLILNHNNLTVVDTQYIQRMLDNNQQISLAKKGIFSLFTENTLYIRTQHAKNGSETNNIEQEYHKITIGFNRVNEIMALPRNMLTVVKNILKKQYFGERCKINDQQILCSKQPIKNITSIKFCVDKKGKKCFQLPIMGRIIQQVKENQKYKLLVQENSNNDSQQQDQDTIVFYPKLAQVLQIYAVKGDVKGTCILGDVQVTPESMGQSKATINKSKKSDEQQEQKSQEKSQEQQSNNKSKKNSQVQQQSQQQQVSEQEQESQVISKKKKQKKEKKGSSKSDQRKQLKGIIQQQKSYSRSLLLALFIYGGLFIIILIFIKLTARESMAAALIDRFLDITWYRIVSGYFSKNQGYTPPQFEQQDGHHQQIDRSDSIAVGISQKEGKTLFWEKNSVQGI